MKKISKLLKLSIIIILCLSAVLFWGAIMPPDNAGLITAAFSSYNTEDGFPAQNILDENPGSFWKIKSGENTGWVELGFGEHALIYGLEISCNITSDSSLKIEYFKNDKWHLFTGAFFSGLNEEDRFIDLSFDKAVTDKIRLKVDGDTADNSTISEVSVKKERRGSVYHKIVPESVVSTNDSTDYTDISLLTDGDVTTFWEPLAYYLSHDKNSEVEQIFNDLGLEELSAYELNGEFDLGGAFDIDKVQFYTREGLEGNVQIEILQDGNWIGISSVPTLFTKGWNTINLLNSNGDNVSKVRIKITGDTANTAGISEVEFWGKGEYKGNEIIPFTLIPGAVLEEDKNFISHTSLNNEYELVLALSDEQEENIDIEINKNVFSLSPKLFLNDSTLYNLTIPKMALFDGENYITVKAAGDDKLLLSSYLKVIKDDGIYKVNNSLLSDGALFNSSEIEGEAEIELLDNVRVENIDIYGKDDLLISLRVKDSGIWEQPVSKSNSYYKSSFRFEGKNIEGIKFTDTENIGEVNIMGSSIVNDEPYVYLIAPEPFVYHPNIKASTFIGYVEDPNAVVTITSLESNQSFTANRYGNYFYLAMNNFTYYIRKENYFVINVVDSAGNEKNLELIYRSADSVPFTVNLIEDVTYTSDSSILVEGTMFSKFYDILINDDIYLTCENDSYSYLYPLEPGFNLIKIELYTRGAISRKMIKDTLIRGVVRTEPSRITVTNPPDGLYTNKSDIDVEGTLTGWAPFEVFVNNNEADVNGNNFNYTLTGLTEGENNINIKAVNKTGQESIKDVSVVLDTVKPVISNLNTQDKISTPMETIIIEGNVTDTSPVYVYIDGEISDVNSGRFRYLTDFGSDGLYNMVIFAEDAAGNKSLEHRLEILIDTTPPESFDLTADPSSWTNNKTPVISFASYDNLSGIDHYELTIDGGDPTIISSPYTLPELTDGIHEIEVRAVNGTGLGTDAVTNVYIDTTAPEKPDDFKVISGVNKATLKWIDDEDVLEYVIFRSPPFSSGESVSKLKINDVTEDSYYVDEDVSSGTTYIYKIHAIDRAYNIGDITDEVSVKIGYAETTIDNSSSFIGFEDVELNIVPDTFNQGDKIVIKETENNLPENDFAEGVGYVYSLRRIDSTGNEIEEKFEKPVAIELSYDGLIPEEDGEKKYAEYELGIYFYDEEQEQWRKLKNIEHDFVNKKLRAKIDHFSDWSIMGSEYSSPSFEEYEQYGAGPYDSFFKNHHENVSTSSGSLSVTSLDFILPGKNGLNIEIARSYNSSIAQGFYFIQNSDSTEELKKTNDPVNTFGWGWSFNIPWVERKKEGLYLKLEGGQQIEVEFNDKVFEYHEGVHFIFTKTSDGDYVLYLKDGTSYNFDSSGKPVEKRSPDGNYYITYNYSEDNPKNISSISDSIGREIIFQYITKGEFSVIEKISYEANGDTYSYDYKYFDDGRLEEYSDPKDRKTSYDYFETTQSMGYKCNVRIVGNQIFKEYDLEGEVVYQNSSQVSREQKSSGKITENKYILLNKITYPTGAESNYVYDVRRFDIEGEVRSSQGGLTGISYVTAKVLDEPSGQMINRVVGIKSKTILEYTITQNHDLRNMKIVVENKTLESSTTSFSYNMNSRFKAIGDMGFINAGTYIHDATVTNIINSIAVVTNEKYDLLYKSNEGYEKVNSDNWLNIIGDLSSDDYKTSLLSERAITLSGNEFETVVYEYNNDLQSVTKETHKKGSNARYSLDYTYDEWGNVTFSYDSRKGKLSNITYEDFNNSIYKNRIKTESTVNRIPDDIDESSYSTDTLTASYYYEDSDNLDKVTRIDITDGTKTFRTGYTYDTHGNLTSEVRTNDINNADDDLITEYYFEDSKNDLKEKYVVIKNVKDPDGVAIGKSVTINSQSVFGIVTEYDYDQYLGHLNSTIDVEGNITSYEYDILGRPANSYFNNEVVSSIVYSDNTGNIKKEYKIENGNKDVCVELFYNNLGQINRVLKYCTLIKDEEPVLTGLKTNYYYDNWGRVIFVVKPGDQITKYDYDALGRLTKIYTPDNDDNTTDEASFENNDFVRLQYNDNNNSMSIYKTYDNGEVKIKEEYKDWAGRMTDVIQYTSYENEENFSVWEVVYDSNNKEIFKKDGKNNIYKQTYNAFGNLKEVLTPSVSYLVPNMNDDVYDIENNLRSGQLTTTYIYDNAGRLENILNNNANVLSEEGQNIQNYEGKTEYDVLGRAIKMTKYATDVITSENIEIVNKVYYDIRGKKVKEVTVDPVNGNKEYVFSYDKKGRLISETDPEGNITSYTYDKIGNKISVTDARGNATVTENDFTSLIEYDELGRVIKTILPDNTYDNTSDNLYSEVRYDIKGNKVYEKNPSGIASRYEYNILGKLTDTYFIDKNGSETHLNTIEYLDSDFIVKSTEYTENGNNITYQYFDSAGRLRKKVMPDLTEKTIKYDEFGREIEVSNGRIIDNIKVTLETNYNALGWVEYTVEPGLKLTKYYYDPNGNQVVYVKPYKQTETPLKHFTKYDELNRAVKDIDSMGQVAKTSFDHSGNVKKSVDVNQVTWDYDYYNNDLVKTVTGTKDGNIDYSVNYEYNEIGKQTLILDSNNTSLEYIYDYLDNITKVIKSFDGTYYTTEYNFDYTTGLTESIKYPESLENIDYSYNDKNQVKQIHGFTSDAKDIAYYNSGMLKEFDTLNGLTNSFTYDNNSRLRSINVTSLSIETVFDQVYNYDEADNISSIEVNSDPNKTRTYQYYANNELLSSTVPENYIEDLHTPGEAGLDRDDFWGEKEISAGFISAEAVVTVDYASASVGLKFDNQFDNLKKLEIIPGEGFENHRIEENTFDIYVSNGVDNFNLVSRDFYEYEKDPETGIITLLFHVKIDKIREVKLHILFDERDENFTSENDKATFLNQLSKILKAYQEAEAIVETFYYDGRGNRTKKNLKLVRNFENSSLFYTDSDRIITDDNYIYKYDNMGNIIEKGTHVKIDENIYEVDTEGFYDQIDIIKEDQTLFSFDFTQENSEYWEYIYDILNRLIKVEKNGIIIAEYEYDPNGLRVVKRKGTVKIHYVFEGNDIIYEKTFDGQSVNSRSYVYAFGKHLARVEGVIGSSAEKYFYTTDHLGSIRTVTDSAGSIKWKAEYNTFGEVLFEDASDDYVKGYHQFTGKEFDADTGFYYYNARWYDSTNGRFISEDPIRDGVNWYVYCGNKPLVFIDKDGYEVKSIKDYFSMEIRMDSATGTIFPGVKYSIKQSYDTKRQMIAQFELSANAIEGTGGMYGAKIKGVIGVKDVKKLTEKVLEIIADGISEESLNKLKDVEFIRDIEVDSQIGLKMGDVKVGIENKILKNGKIDIVEFAKTKLIVQAQIGPLSYKGKLSISELLADLEDEHIGFIRGTVLSMHSYFNPDIEININSVIDLYQRVYDNYPAEQVIASYNSCKWRTIGHIINMLQGLREQYNYNSASLPNDFNSANWSDSDKRMLEILRKEYKKGIVFDIPNIMIADKYKGMGGYSVDYSYPSKKYIGMGGYNNNKIK